MDGIVVRAPVTLLSTFVLLNHGEAAAADPQAIESNIALGGHDGGLQARPDVRVRSAPMSRPAAPPATLGMLLENLNEGVIIGDAAGQVLMCKRAGRAIFGLVSTEAFVPDAMEAFESDGRPLRMEEGPLARAIRGEQFTDYELTYFPATGERRRVVFTGTSAKDESGEVAMAIVVFRDVTDVRHLEQQRREYSALISHDSAWSARHRLAVRLRAEDADDGAECAGDGYAFGRPCSRTR
jgi:PAS domain S-box-containing protein